MRVLYLSHTSQISGAEHALLSLLGRLPEGIAPAVACPQGPLAAAVDDLGIPVFPVSGTQASLKLHPLHTSRGIADMARTATVVRGVSRKFGADLVHANSIRAGLIAVLGRRIGAPRAIVHLYDRLPWRPTSMAALLTIAKGAGGVLACSRYVLKQLPQESVRGVVRVVYNPVDTARLDPSRVDRRSIRQELGIAHDELALALIAQITPWKGQDDAVRIVRNLKQMDQRVRLLLVGSPKFVGEATRYDNLAFSRSLDELIDSFGVQDKVLRLGERHDIPELLGASDIFLAPSWQEPFSLAVIEAMSMELPVLVSSVGGMDELIDGENGVLLPPRDPAQWVQEIAHLAGDQAAREQMGRRARSIVSERLDAPRWAASVVDVYEEVLAGDDRPASRQPTRSNPAVETHPPAGQRLARPLRVLYVNHTSQVSGAERSLLALLAGLNSNVSATVASPEGRLSQEVHRLGLETVQIRGTHGSLKLHMSQTPMAVFSFLQDASVIRGVADELAIDVVHANSIRAAISAGIASRMGGPPVVAHLRDRLPPGPLSTLTFDVLGRSAAIVVANSRYTGDAFPRERLGTPVRVVYNPVDIRRFDPDRLSRAEARRRLGLDVSQAVLGVVAQITPWKAQDDAIRMVGRLKSTLPDVRLLIVGSAKFVSKGTRYDNRRYLEDLRELTRSSALEENVMFLGEREDVPEIMRALDLLLLPSWEEPFGRAIIEAMAMEVPAVATSVGGPTEIVTNGHDGVLLPPRAPQKWAEAVAELLSRPEIRAEMGRRGRERATRAFSLESHVQEMLGLYEEALRDAVSFR